MALAVRRAAVSLERRRAQRSLFAPRVWLVLVAVLAFSGGIWLMATIWGVAFEAGIRAADEDAVYRGVGDAVHLGVRVALRSDSLTRDQRAVARKAKAQLPTSVVDSLRRDSLRTVRWTTP